MSGTRVVLEGPGKFGYGASDLRAEWKRWKRGFNSWLIGAEQDGKKEAVKLNLLLTLLGSEGQDIYETFEWPDTTRTLDEALTRFDSHFTGLSNVTMTRYRFFSFGQGKMSVTDFVTGLKSLANDCEFGELKESLVKDMIVINCSSEKLRERLLKESDLDLPRAVEIARIGEEAEQNVATIGRGADQGSAGAMAARKSGVTFRRPWKFDGNCFECGEHGHMARNCPQRKDRDDEEDPGRDIPDGSNNGERNHGGKTRAGYAASFALKALMGSGNRQGWFVDSGASHHMTSQKDSFDWYEPYRHPRKVTLGDGTVVQVYGQGDMMLNVRAAGGQALVTLKQVQYVPKLQMSLLSVPATTKLGNQVVFRRNVCVVTAGSLRLQCPVNQYGLYEVPVKYGPGGDSHGLNGRATSGGVMVKSAHRNTSKLYKCDGRQTTARGNLQLGGKVDRFGWTSDAGTSSASWPMGGGHRFLVDPGWRTQAGGPPRFQDSPRTKAGGQGYPGASTLIETKAGGQGYPGTSTGDGTR